MVQCFTYFFFYVRALFSIMKLRLYIIVSSKKTVKFDLSVFLLIPSITVYYCSLTILYARKKIL